MAKTRSSKGPRARLFVALDLPEERRAALADWRDALVAGRDDLRPVAPTALHVTLVFLGWQWERDVDRIAGSMSRAAEGVAAPVLSPAGVLPIPPRGAPRLFALDLEDDGGRSVELQSALAAALEDLGVYEPERRQFWPHVTLARVKRRRRAAALAGPAPPSAAMRCQRLTLYRSTLRPQGAVYDALRSMDLT